MYMRSALLVLSLVVLAGCQEDPAAQIQPAPVPKWSPPATTLPGDFVEAVKVVQAHGFGHPKPLRYITAEVRLGSVWQPDLTSQVNGWLIDGNQVLVSSGVAYALVKEVGPADLGKDLAANDVPLRGIRLNEPQWLSPSGVATLLIAGEVKKAEALFPKIGKVERPVRMLASAFVFAKMDKAATAHMRGDSVEAIREAKALLKMKGPLNEAMEKEEPGRTHDGDNFGHLKVLEQVIADNERRMREKRAPVDLAAIAKLPEAERISKLIEALDQVDATQDGQPGGVDLVSHPIVAELANIGAAAMPAIFDCMEKDKRLTRSVSFPRDFKVTRNFIPVSSAAVAAYQRISEDFDTMTATPAELRARWSKNAGLSPAERQFKILEEEGEGRQWRSAAAYMVEPTSMVRTSNSSWRGTEPKAGGPPPAMKGEPLRSRVNPSVTDLIKKRASDLIDSWKNEGHKKFDLDYALQLVSILNKWDHAAALDTAQLVSRVVMQDTDGRAIDQWPHFATAIRVRVELGDRAALSEYAAWVKERPLETYYSGSASAFEPLIRFRTEPVMQQAARDFAAHLKSNLPKAAGTNQIEGILTTPLLQLEPIRDLVLSLLSDNRKVGDVWIEKKTVWISQPHGKGGRGLAEDARDVPKDGIRQPHRASDALAMTLLQRDRSIAFEPYWPVAKRDAALAKLRRMIKSGEFSVPKWDGITEWSWR